MSAGECEDNTKYEVRSTKYEVAKPGRDGSGERHCGAGKTCAVEVFVHHVWREAKCEVRGTKWQSRGEGTVKGSGAVLRSPGFLARVW